MIELKQGAYGRYVVNEHVWIYKGYLQIATINNVVKITIVGSVIMMWDENDDIISSTVLYPDSSVRFYGDKYEED